MQMTELCTNAIKDDSEEMETIPTIAEMGLDHDDKAKRMLDFSRKSPKVTFHSEVIRIPFENYFHPEAHEYDENDGRPVDEDHSGHADDDDHGDHNEVGVATESIHCEFNVDAAFQKLAFISTPVELFKEKHHLGSTQAPLVEKSPRTQLVEKGSQLREKIRELEEETLSFREQNRQIQKLKQCLELEKVELHNRRSELERTFKEQQQKMESYYGQLKETLDEERARSEQRAMVPSKKLKEETKNLRDKIDELEKEAKNREVKHGASQTRLRCHIKTLEKEVREQATTIETIKKENKRLEAENARLLRQKNSKMLTEINKNIAKLQATTNTAANEGKKQETVAPKKHGVVAPKMLSKNNSTAVSSNARSNSRKEEHSMSSSSASLEGDSETDSVADPPNGPSNYFPLAEALQRGKRATTAHHESEKENANHKVAVAAPLNETAGPKKEVVREDGSKDVYYANGNLKKISGDGMVVKVLYFNKDIKETNINEGTVKYYYAETKTWHTSYLDGLEILEFPRCVPFVYLVPLLREYVCDIIIAIHLQRPNGASV